MIGSSSVGCAFSYADLNAIEPATLNAISDESTVWYEPSTSRTRTPWIGAPGELAGGHRLLDPLVDRRPEALRDHAADDLVDELVADVALERLDHDVAVAELAAAAGLLLVAALRARLGLDRLDVRDARLVQLDLDAEAALEPRDRDLDVHLAHPREQLLAGLGVAAELKRRVLLVQPPQRLGDLVLVALRLRRDREAHHRLGERRARGGLDLALGSASRSPVWTSFSFATAPMSPSHERVGLLVLLPLQHHQPAEPLLGLVAQVDERRVGGDGAAVDAERVDPPGERVGDRLEDERGGAAARVDPVEPLRAGDGTPSTSRSSSACVPRFFVATPQATG